HNPVQWNALKLLNQNGEFISETDGAEVLELARNQHVTYAENNKLGGYRKDDTYIDKHIDAILKLPLVDVEAIKAKKFTIAIDCVNSTGGIAIPKLLRALGAYKVEEFYC